MLDRTASTQTTITVTLALRSAAIAKSPNAYEYDTALMQNATTVVQRTMHSIVKRASAQISNFFSGVNSVPNAEYNPVEMDETTEMNKIPLQTCDMHKDGTRYVRRIAELGWIVFVKRCAVVRINQFFIGIGVDL